MNRALKQNVYHSCHPNSTHASKVYFSNSRMHSNLHQTHACIQILQMRIGLTPRSKLTQPLLPRFAHGSSSTLKASTCSHAGILQLESRLLSRRYSPTRIAALLIQPVDLFFHATRTHAVLHGSRTYSALTELTLSTPSPRGSDTKIK
jgi:hypothetical protein